MDIQIDTNSDLLIQNGDFQWVKGAYAIGQHVKMRLQTWLGETPYDTAAGVPYLQVIFQAGTSRESIKFILEQAVLATPGVTGVNLSFDFDNATREMTVTGTLTALNEEIPFSITVTPP